MGTPLPGGPAVLAGQKNVLLKLIDPKILAEREKSEEYPAAPEEVAPLRVSLASPWERILWRSDRYSFELKSDPEVSIHSLDRYNRTPGYAEVEIRYTVPAGLIQVASPLFFVDSRGVIPLAGTKALHFVRPGVVRYAEGGTPVWEMTVNSGQYHASAMAVLYRDDTIYLFVLEEEWFPPRNTGNQLFRYGPWVIYQVITTKGD